MKASTGSGIVYLFVQQLYYTLHSFPVVPELIYTIDRMDLFTEMQREFFFATRYWVVKCIAATTSLEVFR